MDTITVILLIVLVLLIAAANLRSLVSKEFRDVKTNLPGPKGWPVIGSALLLKNVNTSKDSYRVFSNIAKAYDAPLFSIWFGPTKLVIYVKEAKYIERLLNHRALSWKSYFYAAIRKITKNAVFTREGEKWERLRKPLMHFTKPKNVENFHEKIKNKIPILCKRIESKCGTGSFNVTTMCKAWALEVFVYTSFDFDNIYTEEQLERMVHLGEKYLDHAFTDMMSLKANLGFKTFNEANCDRDLKVHADRIIELRKAQLIEQGRDLREVIDNPENYIDVVLQVGEEEGLPEGHLGLMLVDVVFGALDSPGTVMMTMMLFLAMEPEYQEKLYREQIDYFGDSLRPPEENDLKNLPYLDMVMKEAIRLCAPPAVSRKAEEDIEIDGYHLPKGAVVAFSIDTSLNDPKYWEKPNAFYPDHFLPEAAAKREKGAYLPFATGPKMCPGQLYTYPVVKTALSVAVRQFEFETKVKYSDIEYKILLMKEVVDPQVSIKKRNP